MGTCKVNTTDIREMTKIRKLGWVLIACIQLGVHPHEPIAQISFLEADTAVWRYSGSPPSVTTIFIDRQLMLSSQEVTVDNKTYRRVYGLLYFLANHHYNEIPPECERIPWHYPPTTAALIREEGQKVYYWPSMWPNEYLAYDMGLNVGDTLPTPFVPGPGGTQLSSYTVEKVDSVQLDGRLHKRFKIAGLESQYIVEGIGLLSYPFHPFAHEISAVTLHCHARDGTVLLQTNDTCEFWSTTFDSLAFICAPDTMMGGPDTTLCEPDSVLCEPDTIPAQVILAFPNPARGNIRVMMSRSATYDVELFDMHGRQHEVGGPFEGSSFEVELAHLPRAMYILIVHTSGRKTGAIKLLLQ